MDEWNHSIPYCRQVKVDALEQPDTAPVINYSVPVRGTTEEDMSVSIQGRLQTSGNYDSSCSIIINYSDYFILSRSCVATSSSSSS